MSTSPTAHISLSALEQNAALLCTRLSACTPRARLMAVVKSNAYGMGLLPCADALFVCGIRDFATASVAEALALTSAHPDARVLVLGAVAPEEADAAALASAAVSVYSPEYAAVLSNSLTSPIDIHIKLDCGMHRLGIDCSCPERALSCIAAISAMPNLRIAGFFSHLSEADEPNSSITPAQIACFSDMVLRLRSLGYHAETHLCASAALLSRGSEGLSMARSGISLFGYSPSPCIKAPTLIPVLTVTAPVLQIKEVRQGEGVGYGSVYTAPRDTRVATVAMGYADGLPRTLSDASFLWHGRRIRQAGRVSMEYFSADIGDLPVREGDAVVVYPRDNDAMWDIARRAGTIPYELLARLGGRVERIYRK